MPGGALLAHYHKQLNDCLPRRMLASRTAFSERHLPYAYFSIKKQCFQAFTTVRFFVFMIVQLQMLCLIFHARFFVWEFPMYSVWVYRSGVVHVVVSEFAWSSFWDSEAWGSLLMSTTSIIGTTLGKQAATCSTRWQRTLQAWPASLPNTPVQWTASHGGAKAPVQYLF